MAVPDDLFETVARRDYLQFWDGPSLQTRAVARFLDLSKAEVAHVAGVAPTSVRFDQKIPKQALDRLTQLANLCGLVAGYFEGNVAKTSVWFQTKNPLLGGVSPPEMILNGRSDKLRACIVEALNAAGAKPDPFATPAITTPGLALIQAHRPRLRCCVSAMG